MSSVEAAPLPEYPKGAFLIDLSVMPGINEARREFTHNFECKTSKEKQGRAKQRQTKTSQFILDFPLQLIYFFLEKWGFFSSNI